MQFQNTEFHGNLTYEELDKELTKHEASVEQIYSVFEMKLGERLTIEVGNEKKLWFYYINKIKAIY